MKKGASFFRKSSSLQCKTTEVSRCCGYHNITGWMRWCHARFCPCVRTSHNGCGYGNRKLTILILYYGGDIKSNALSILLLFNCLLSTAREARGVDVRWTGRSRESDTAESLSLFPLTVVVGDKLTHRICLHLRRVASPQVKKMGQK